MTAHPRKDTFLSTATVSEATAWDGLLRVQVDLFLPEELRQLRQIDAWRSARTVTDIGCGNGYYLDRLRSAVPDKAYCGIDVSPELIDMAQARYSAPNLQFCSGDFLKDGAPHGDILVLRFVLQHLTDLRAVLDQADCALSRSGSVIVIEPDLASSVSDPELPLFFAMLRAFEDHRRSNGFLRHDVARLGDRIAEFPGWTVASERIGRVRTKGPFTGTPTEGAMLGWLAMCQRVPQLEFPFAKVRKEIADWSRHPNGASDIGIRIVEIRRAKAGG